MLKKLQYYMSGSHAAEQLLQDIETYDRDGRSCDISSFSQNISHLLRAWEEVIRYRHHRPFLPYRSDISGPGLSVEDDFRPAYQNISAIQSLSEPANPLPLTRTMDSSNGAIFRQHVQLLAKGLLSLDLEKLGEVPDLDRLYGLTPDPASIATGDALQRIINERKKPKGPTASEAPAR